MKSPAAVHALVSVLLLAGYYVLTVGTALVLLLLGIGMLYFHGLSKASLLANVILALPALTLIAGTVSARAPAFAPPGPQLDRQHAPVLFAMIDGVAGAADTRAPELVYLSHLPNLAVTAAPIRGQRSRRALILGVPALALLSQTELRAVLAHEMGHFAAGDTWLARIDAFAVETFRSVLLTGQREPFSRGTQHWSVEAGLEAAQTISHGYARFYAGLFFRFTSSMNRREELAADRRAAELVGKEPLARALKRLQAACLFWSHQQATEVTLAARYGAIPADLIDRFPSFIARMSSTPEGRALLQANETRHADPTDTHPPLEQRLRAMGLSLADAATPPVPNLETGIELLPDPQVSKTWATEASARDTGRRGSFRLLTWDRIPSEVIEPALRVKARRMASVLHAAAHPYATTIPEMFADVVSELVTSGPEHLASIVQPSISLAQGAERARLVAQNCALAVGALLAGALLERGGRVELVTGSVSVFVRLGEALIAPETLAQRGSAGLEELQTWARRLTDDKEAPVAAQ